jgi:hypothetical protein
MAVLLLYAGKLLNITFEYKLRPRLTQINPLVFAYAWTVQNLVLATTWWLHGYRKEKTPLPNG